MNIASRMESHGLGGTIQFTRAAWELIRDELECKPRRALDVTGRWEMEVWLARSAKQVLPGPEVSL